MYSPKIKEDLILKIYQKAKAQVITMTSLVDKIIRKALNDSKSNRKKGKKNEKGELVAYAGRYPGDPPEGESKYVFPPNFKKSYVIFNLNRVKDNDKEKELILVEGSFDVFNLWQAGVENVVALMGTTSTKEQEELILRYLGKDGMITLIFDSDEAGKKATKEATEKLIKKVYIKIIRLKDEIDLDKISKNEINNLI